MNTMPNQLAQVNRIYSEKELAKELGLSYWTVRKFRLELGMPHFRTEKRVFYRLDPVLKWIDAKEQSSRCEPETTEQYRKLRRVQ